MGRDGPVSGAVPGYWQPYPEPLRCTLTAALMCAQMLERKPVEEKPVEEKPLGSNTGGPDDAVDCEVRESSVVARGPRARACVRRPSSRPRRAFVTYSFFTVM